MTSVAENYGKLTEERLGVLLHYDDSASDPGAVEWLLKDARCKVSYNWLVLDDGRVVEVAPADKRAWHAGVCKPSSRQLPYRDANSAFYGIAWAGRDQQAITPAALVALLDLVRGLFTAHHWPLTDSWRITGHDREAWPRGRKIDPTGTEKARPVLSVELVQLLLPQLKVAA
jgi:N-acetyl-anhydromuramyl-L-alanine amidase AmpD